MYFSELGAMEWEWKWQPVWQQVCKSSLFYRSTRSWCSLVQLEAIQSMFWHIHAKAPETSISTVWKHFHVHDDVEEREEVDITEG